MFSISGPSTMRTFSLVWTSLDYRGSTVVEISKISVLKCGDEGHAPPPPHTHTLPTHYP